MEAYVRQPPPLIDTNDQRVGDGRAGEHPGYRCDEEAEYGVEYFREDGECGVADDEEQRDAEQHRSGRGRRHKDQSTAPPAA